MLVPFGIGFFLSVISVRGKAPGSQRAGRGAGIPWTDQDTPARILFKTESVHPSGGGNQ
jgi:hypothetical protein